MTRNRLSTNAATEGVVQEFIDTAYDIVKEVYDNLDNLQLVVDAINNLNPAAFATAAQGITADSALQPDDIDTLPKLNALITGATLIDTTDARLSDTRDPNAHTHVSADITDLADFLLATDIDTLAELNAILTDATLGDSADFATAAQGALAASASQPGHTHVSADITDFGTFVTVADIDSLAELNAILLDATLIDTADPRLSDARTPTAHTHVKADITDLGSVLSTTAINTLAKLNAIVTDATLIDTADARLSDNRDPNAHTHTEAEISDLGIYVTELSISTLAGLNALVLDATLGDSADFATAAQGVLADSAVQPGDIGTAAAQNVGYFATAAQGAKADSALQVIPPDYVTMDMLVDIPTDSFLGRVTAVTGTVEVLTNAQAKAALDLAGSNTGDQATIVGISSTKAEFDAALSDGNFAYAGGAFHDSFSDYVADEHMPSATFATAAQGALADSAVQPIDINTLAALNALLTDATLGDVNDFISIATIAGRMLLKGSYDASTNTPDLDVAPTGVLKGDTYYVSVAGSFFGSVNLEVGDKITALNDDAATFAEWTITNKNISTVDFATAAQGATADTALQPEDINTLAKLNAIVAETLIDDAHPGLGPDEGTEILSTGESAGKVLVAQGDNSSAWETPAPVEGINLLSTTVTVGKVLQADGDNSCSWVTPFTYASTLTTKGDLEAFSTVRGRLPIGTNGKVLTADSTQAFGMGWQSLPTAPNPGYLCAYVSVGTSIAEGYDIFSDAGLTHSLPGSPQPGDRCRVRDYSKGAGTNAITVQRNGSTINGAAANFTMDEDGQIVTFMCDTAGNWITSSVSDVPIDLSAKVKVITGVTYTVLEADNGYRLIFDNASAIAVTLPDGLSLHHNFIATQVNTGVPTITPVTDTINGAGTGVAPDNQWGSLYFVQYAYADWLAEYTKAGSYLSLP